MKQIEKSLQWRALKEEQQVTFQIIGELSRDTLSALWLQQDSFLAQSHNLSLVFWDLSQLYKVDSAGFAFLCQLIKASQRYDVQVKVINLPQQIITLSELFGLNKWLKAFLTAN